MDWIEELRLAPHPEGGWFRRVYESGIRLQDGRPAMTSIYYLLQDDDFSALHRLKSDEQWHFYQGSSITIHEIDAAGAYGAITLGPACFQHTVKSGILFGATVEVGFALVGCTVAPGFDYADFELPSRARLLEDFPQHRDLILRLSRE
jgi:predicted cupin superfamily sugar epimerase